MGSAKVMACVCGMFAWGVCRAWGQGSLTPPGPPGESMKSLQQVWDSLQILQLRVQSNQTATASLSEQLKTVGQRVADFSAQQGVAAALIVDLARAQGLSVSNVWMVQSVDNVSGFSFGAHTSLAFTPSGSPAVSYYDSAAEDLKYAVRDGAAWTVQTVDSDGSVGKHNTLAFAPSGSPAIAYYDASSQTVKYAVYENGTWSIQTVASFVGTETHLSLAFTPSGYPAIAYYSESSSSLRYAEWSGTAWRSQSVSASGNGTYVSLAVSPSGHAAMCFSSNASGDLVYLENASNTWSTVWSGTVVDADGNVGTHSSLAFSPAGFPSIAYFWASGMDLKFAEYDGDAWRIFTVDSLGMVGRYCSLAYTPVGRPAISYVDETYERTKYAERSGSAWQLQSVDRQTALYPYTSLAFTPDGRPAVSYYDADTLKYAEAAAIHIGP